MITGFSSCLQGISKQYTVCINWLNNLSKEDELWTKKPFNDLRIKEEFRGFSPKIEISSLMFDQQSQFSQDHWLNKSDFLSDFFVRYVPKEIKLWIDNLPNRMKMKEDSW